ncbi:zf-HC2 domain-containing protein [Roseibium algae]|uniref:Zf-HC2 domain-containing protein n=1 Tax=Roseibium algae TaxID=3123038 RepID=A0ABU8TE56_9HYPH
MPLFYRRTQLLDSSKWRSANNHDDVWELIPWFVNGSLSEAEKDRVKQHMLTCTDCAAEVARQYSLAKKVMTEDPFDPPLARSWSKLRAQIKAEERADTPRIDVRRWFAGWQGGIMFAGAGLAACLLAAVIIIPTDNNDFRTLTSGNQALQNAIKFQIKVDVSNEKLQGLLAEHGLTLAGGPSETGVYTVTAPNDVDLKTLSEELMIAPEVMFAAPVQQP